MISLHCCGETYHADDQHVGRKIMCRSCGRIMTIQTGTEAVSTQAARPSAPFASAPAFATLRKPQRLTRAIAGILGGLLIVGLAAWGILARSRQGPVSQIKASGPTPSSFWSPVAPTQPQQAPAHEAVSLPTGTWILKQRGYGGRGVLKIENGSDMDSAVRLVTDATPRRSVWMRYIRAHDEQETSGIGAGNYLLRFTLGQD